MEKVKSWFRTKEETINPEEHIRRLREVLQPDCEVRGNPDSCHQLGEFYQIVEKNLEMAEQTWNSNCMDRGVGESCFSLGYMLLTRKGRDVHKALQLFDKACKKDVYGACHNAAVIYNADSKDTTSVEKDAKKAVTLFSKACDGGYRNSCFYLSAIYLNGTKEIPKDMKKAFEYSTISCDMGHGWACANLGRMYTIGDGVDKDEKKAATFKKKAKQLMGKDQR